MSTLKTATSALTAVALVTGISLAWAQADDSAQPTPSTTAAGTMPSEQTPADPNAPTTGTMAVDPANTGAPAATNPPVDSTAQLPANSTATPNSLNTNQAATNANGAPSSSSMDNSNTSTANSSSMSSPSTGTDSTYNNNATNNRGSTYEPAPRADRN
ncbi:hypothetical protein [Pelomonas cellulosilytica]|uniref:Proteophosphoglycan ppg4 n=1 Tax=Pelomonas cellulosilytica TaxID=2906762 RepID=A0ABS8XY56_9BURK|nr:hypothetical protein [Pelomonas sp. P8]MCE4555546.1 hypothetical protein [Pelomonas sp. P8]